MKEIDARGLACPAPVLQTKAAIELEGAVDIQVTVDNPAAQQNVQRFMESKGFSTRLDSEGGDYHITGHAAEGAAGAPTSAAAPAKRTPQDEHQRIVVLCATDRLGSGDDVLGRKLMINFIKTLKEMGPDLWQLIFVNNGVKLAIDDSPVLDELKAYEADGLTILVCGTCLDHFNLLERKKVGTTTNMLDIVTAMQLADKTISL
ncbi:sulfurtransferase-like selenium metabolism protein YedF [Desulfatitalea alkaliphila]|uniref:Sulfurtransferase-like selenium metabolism protein YedF n=1 Tax=Desulfatitalea alkaliphila TaxID=2929485 RepID=A0AA41ULA9_9BACT|nr:sulfurtransferase-like selenium metabolism protein YedF [Desulfatitalea alkaliphila]MCJ8502272.1 sulfurtransferase-like selenium metabolism protein YedF [Desulfatitalea alkaliphila]